MRLLINTGQHWAKEHDNCFTLTFDVLMSNILVCHIRKDTGVTSNTDSVNTNTKPLVNMCCRRVDASYWWCSCGRGSKGWSRPGCRGRRWWGRCSHMCSRTGMWFQRCYTTSLCHRPFLWKLCSTPPLAPHPTPRSIFLPWAPPPRCSLGDMDLREKVVIRMVLFVRGVHFGLGLVLHDGILSTSLSRDRQVAVYMIYILNLIWEYKSWGFWCHNCCLFLFLKVALQ